MILNVAVQAKPVKKVKPIKNDVIFEVVLDKEVKNKPYIMVYHQGINERDMSHTGEERVQPKSRKGNTYYFEIKNQSKPSYFSLMLADSVMDVTVANGYHFEPGDDIKITAEKTSLNWIYDLNFSGKGSAKYKCQNEFKYAMQTDTVKSLAEFTADDRYNPNNQSLRYTDLLFGLIDKYQPEMSDYSCNLLHADVLGEMGKHIFAQLRFLLMIKMGKDMLGFRRLTKSFSDNYKVDYLKGVPDSVLVNSKEYSDFLLERIRTQVLMANESVNYNLVYAEIKKIPNLPLRDKMIIDYFRHYWELLNDNYSEILRDALSGVKDKKNLAILKNFEHQATGSKAFDFSLTDVNNKKVALSDFKGKVVFIDFWFTGCVHCEDYYQDVISKAEISYKGNKDLVFMTISIDKSKEMWLKSLNSGVYTAPQAINLYTNGEGSGHEIIKYYNINGYPRPMLIGRDGVIVKFTGLELRNKNNLILEIDKALAYSKK